MSMAFQVDHDERRKEILTKALRLIGERGYEQVTYQQIADICGLARTSLYKYYKNKREIFDQALMRMVSNIGDDFQQTVSSNPDLSVVEKIHLIVTQTIDIMYKNPPLLQTIVEYLISMRRREEPVDRKIRRHTIGFHRLLTNLVWEGIAKGELRQMDCTLASEMLYALLETATLRITLIEGTSREQLIKMCGFALEGMKAE